MRLMLTGLVVVLATACGGDAPTVEEPTTPEAATEPAPSLEPSTPEPATTPTETETAATEEPSEAVTTEPPAAAVDFCSALREVVVANNRFLQAIFAADQAGVDAFRTAFPDLAADVRASAPADVAADVDRVLSLTEEVVGRLEGVDLSAGDADLDGLFAGLDDPEVQAASDRVGEYARSECGFDPDEVEDDPLPQLPEPPDPCTLLDVVPVASAAGVEVDPTDEDGGASADFGVFVTRSCSYGNGAVSVSTYAFADPTPAAAREVIVELAEDNDGSEVTGVDLRTLPASTVVTDVRGAVSISVVEATPPFSLAFPVPDVDDPAALVAAAEVALEQLR